eukprot:scaffold8100_cov66-Cyclotella_meneghiniana.AAC.3
MKIELTKLAPAPTGSLFGSNPAPAPSGGLFGSTAPAPSGGLFGSTAPAPSGGLFGSSASAPSGGLFGTTPATAAPFGAQTNPHQAAYHAHQSASAQQEAARIQEAVSNLQSKYSSTAPGAPNVPSSHCAFTAILYDALTGEQRSAIASLSTTQTTTYLNNQMASMSLSATVIPRPPHIPPKVWNEAQARNPNHGELTPVALIGASALHSRLVGQQEKATKLGQDATKLKESLDFLSKACTKSRTGIRQASLEQEALQRRLLEVMRKVEIVRCMGQPIQQAEREGMDRMERLLRDVNVLTRGMMDVEERAREQSRVWKRKAASGMSGNVDWTLDNEDKAALMEVLNEQSWGLDGLSHIVKRDERDVGILKEELEKAYNTSNSSVGSDRTKKPIQVGEGGVAIFTGH